MGYALFAQRKVVLNSQLNTIQLQQTQRSNEQYILATDELSLNQQLSSMQASQAGKLAELFGLLSSSTEDGAENPGKTNTWMAPYMVPFASAEEYYEAEAQKTEEGSLYIKYFGTAFGIGTSEIQSKIEEIKQENQQELDEINNELYLVSVKENSIEMEVKRLDTKVSALQKQLEAVEEAEGAAIDRATPKFNGVA